MHSAVVVSVRCDVTGNGNHFRGNGCVCGIHLLYGGRIYFEVIFIAYIKVTTMTNMGGCGRCMLFPTCILDGVKVIFEGKI